MRNLSPAMLAASALGIASLAFAGGFAVSASTGQPAQAGPIVNVDAWNETPPVAPVEIRAKPAARCNPWDVSEIAMEEMLEEMMRRGWRQPRQGDAVAVMAELGVDGMAAVDPYAPMPSRTSTAMITVLSDADAERLRNNEITIEDLTVLQTEPLPPPS